MFKKRYRIVKDNYAGFEVQVKYWYWPFWLECDGTNTFHSLERAREAIETFKGSIVYEEKY